MTSNLIKFHSCHISNNENEFSPVPVKNYIPEWYKKKDKYIKNNDGFYELLFGSVNGKSTMHRLPSWKSCPALLDVFLTGYYLLTPCDIEFKIINNDGFPPVEIFYDEKWKEIRHDKSILSTYFCVYRNKEDGLPHPEDYHEFTYAWRPNYYAEVPEGYTLLYVHPMNIPNLPFKTMSGFIDSTNPLIGNGNIPFYLKKNWEGVIPAGTPYAQVIPIKNESWKSEIINYSLEEMLDQINKKEKDYMIGHHLTRYKEKDWTKKTYE